METEYSSPYFGFHKFDTFEESIHYCLAMKRDYKLKFKIGPYIEYFEDNLKRKLTEEEITIIKLTFL
jgi:hypothetical protein